MSYKNTINEFSILHNISRKEFILGRRDIHYEKTAHITFYQRWTSSINSTWSLLELEYRKGDDYMIEEKALLNVDETRAYLGLGDTMTRQLMRKEYFGLRIGCRLYSSKILLDKWIGEQAKKKR